LKSIRPVVLLSALAILCAQAQTPRRLVILKIDGLPAGLVDRYVREHNPVTGKSRLPWIDHVFRQDGAILQNFYVRGISLSVPSWSMLDTGQHPVIHGNVEYDRYTLRVYDYMNFFPFYVKYARSKQVDATAVEVLDEAGVPLMIDRYPVTARYQSLQLYQRGILWKTLQGSLIHRITSRSPSQLFNEWQTGFSFSSGVSEQIKRELDEKLSDPKILYLDYFSGDYDHIAHLTNDPATQYDELKHVDALVGRVWTAIQASPLAQNTILVLVSDHGMNTIPVIYSQGYSLVNFFNSAEGGGHHVVTNRHPMDQYKLKGLDPFVSQVTTPSSHSFYLRDQADDYPTTLLDLDGNERACIHLRNSHLNEIHILLQHLSRKNLTKEQRAASTRQFYQVLEEQRPQWNRELEEMRDELEALKRRIDRQAAAVKNQPHNWTQEERESGLDRDARREAARLRSWEEDLNGYTEYSRILSRLLKAEPPQIDPSKLRIEDVIPKHAMGDHNSIYDLRNYVVGESGGEFRRVDYFALLAGIRVRNNVQAGIGNRPVDFVAVRVPRESLDGADGDGVWIYESETSQALILARTGAAGLELRYLPIRSLQQERSGALHFTTEPIHAGLPLRMFEDPNLNVPGDRAEWLAAWHSEREWLDAVHRTAYSNGIIGLHEQLSLELPPPMTAPVTEDDKLLRRFELRRRHNAAADMLVIANDHWNFNARGFNPGGNHGSFFRVSTHSVWMLAGAGVPKGLAIDRPYDSLSFVPTLLSLAGALNVDDPKRFPGPVVEELRNVGQVGNLRPIVNRPAGAQNTRPVDTRCSSAPTHVTIER
jgi:hypothetical protein